MELTERLLNDAGGWQIMKQARTLHTMGRVSGAEWQPPLLQGKVREGEMEFRSGMKILSKTNVENLCGCRMSRQYGAICAHSVAVGLEVLNPAVPTSLIPPESNSVSATPEAIKPVFLRLGGAAVKLYLVLPPNFLPAWKKGSLQIGVEVECGGKRLLLSALSKNATYACEEAAAVVIQTVRELTQQALPGMVSLDGAGMLKLLATSNGFAGVSYGRRQEVLVEPKSISPRLETQFHEDGSLTLKAELPAGCTVLAAAGASPWLHLANGNLQACAAGLPGAYQAVLEQPVTIPAAAAGGFLAQELPTLARYFQIPDLQVPSTPAKVGRVTAAAEAAPNFALELEGSLNFLTARLKALYGDRAYTLASGAPARAAGRNAAAEGAAVERLRRAGFSMPDAEGQMVLKGEKQILAFFARDLPIWERTAKVNLGARFEHVTKDIERIAPKLEVRGSGENWFELEVELATRQGERFAASEIQRLLQSGQTSVRTKNGKLAVFSPEMLDELQETLRDCDPQQQRPGTYRIGQRFAPFLEATAAEQGARLAAPAAWREAVARLQNPGAAAPVDLGSLAEVLRPYQAQGVRWMHQLAQQGLAGILADEMGLGKTVQALALLRALGGRSLVVCPSSLVYNWQREARNFTPERRVLLVEGGQREALFGAPIREADLVITSYALLRRDAEHYRKQEFQVVVLDEAQHIKNPETQNASAAYAIRSRHRFVLTGTPVENSVRDLWSLMHFLMPGFLGKQEDFRERFQKPIEAEPGGPAQQRLARRLRPFILRRRKRDVASELPEKIEQIAMVELTSRQKALYAELLTATRRQVSELAGQKDQGKARILILTALLRLRQACCDLRLLNLAAEQPEAEASGKLELLGELLQEMIDGGHRVLIFSQFVGMLKLIRQRLEAEEVPFCYLDGSTRNRAAEVDRFQTGTVPVFLISLKAGGVGLNLTAADTVVHFDPWWNPAVEAQATDRAHRIGQDKVVTAYKLIARGTVEEKILQLQQKKRQLIDATVESEEPVMQGLTGEDITELLS